MNRSALLLLAAALAAATPVDAQSPPASPDPAAAAAAPLFASHDVLDVTLVADFELLDDDRAEDNPERPATLHVAGPDGAPVELAVEVRTRGNFRLRPSTCDFPNLRLDFPASSSAQPTVFTGQGALKLVGHCRGSGEYDQNVLEEYLVYRLYNLLTEESFRVRLARVTYRDVRAGEEPLTRHAFLIENVDRLAARLGGLHIEVQGVQPHDLDGLSSARVELFQYMIGNTDFSVVNFHNVELIRLPDGTYHPVPYDFDFSGLVDAPYATPSAVLGTRSVRERVYRGFCRPGVDASALFEAFRAIRESATRLFREQPELEPKRAESAIRYLDEFYRTIESRRAREALIERRCRTRID